MACVQDIIVTQTCDRVCGENLALISVCPNNEDGDDTTTSTTTTTTTNNNNNNNNNSLFAWPTVQLTVHITVIFGFMCLTAPG